MIVVADVAHVRLIGDRAGRYVVTDERPDGTLVLKPEDSTDAMLERHGLDPGTVEEFEGEFGAVAPPDGEG